MSQTSTSGPDAVVNAADRAPGDERTDGAEAAVGLLGYTLGLGLAALLTAVAFGVSRIGLFWEPSIPVAISVLAVAQIGVHLVFFLHIGSGPDSTNNIMALAFGVMIVLLLVLGSLWIMSHLNHNMMSTGMIMQMQR